MCVYREFHDFQTVASGQWKKHDPRDSPCAEAPVEERVAWPALNSREKLQGESCQFASGLFKGICSQQGVGNDLACQAIICILKTNLKVVSQNSCQCFRQNGPFDCTVRLHANSALFCVKCVHFDAVWVEIIGINLNAPRPCAANLWPLYELHLLYRFTM